MVRVAMVQRYSMFWRWVVFLYVNLVYRVILMISVLILIFVDIWVSMFLLLDKEMEASCCCRLRFRTVLLQMQQCLVQVVRVLSLSFLVLLISNDLTLLGQLWFLSYDVEDESVPSTILMTFFMSLLYSSRSAITSWILLLYSSIRGIISFFRVSSVLFSFEVWVGGGDAPSILWISLNLLLRLLSVTGSQVKLRVLSIVVRFYNVLLALIRDTVGSSTLALESLYKVLQFVIIC